MTTPDWDDFLDLVILILSILGWALIITLSIFQLID